MTLDESFVRDLISQTENEKLEFKQKWYWHKDDQNKDNQKGELVKDIISLANGGLHTIGQDGYLIIGVNDKNKDIINIDIDPDKSCGKLKDEITDLLKNYTNLPISLNVEYLELDQKNIIVIQIINKNKMIFLEKELKDSKNKRFSPGCFIYRNGASVCEANEETKKAFQKEISSISKYPEKKSKTNHFLDDDITIEASDILELLVAKVDKNKLSKNQGIRKDHINYEYYILDKSTKEIYIFLGELNKQHRNIDSFQNFSEKLKKDKPNILKIFIVKRYRYEKIIDGKIDINAKIKQFDLDKIIPNIDIYYLDDFIWENTISKNKKTELYKNQNFIDQDIFSHDSETLGKSISFFEKELLNSLGSPISIIHGLGGVGKTTFCDTLNYKISKNKKEEFKTKKTFLLKSDRLKYYLNENTKIESLDDLYTLYKDDPSVEDFNDISLSDFKLNFVSGNIVVIIDAIEEIDSVLDTRFNIQEFFNSLIKLYERFKSIKIVITSRGIPFLNKINDLNIKPNIIEFYEIKGFKSKDINDYLYKKYNENKNKINAAKEFIENYQLSTSGHITPLILDLVCEIINRPDNGYSHDSTYFLKNEPIDKVLITLLNREIQNQSLHIDIDNFFYLLEEIVIDKNGSISKQEFEETIKALTNQTSSNYIKNPLFMVDNSNVKLRFDFLNSLIKSRYLYNTLKTEKNISNKKLVKVLKDCYLGENEVFNELLKIIKYNDINIIKESLKIIINRFKLEYSQNEENKIAKENIQKSISAILYMCKEIKKSATKEDLTSFIADIYECDSYIKNVFIYGEFTPLDFTKFNWSECSFVRYNGFSKSKFPEEDKTIFFYTRFFDIEASKSTKLRKSFFDSSCHIDDKCNFSKVIEALDTKKEDKINLVKEDIVSILKYMDTYKRSFNKISQHCKVKYHKGLRTFLGLLNKHEVIKIIKDGNDDFYKINDNLIKHVPNIKIHIFPETLDKVISDIAEYY